MEEIINIKKENGQNIAGKIYIPDEAGNANKYPTIVLAHGFNSNYRVFEKHAKKFAEAGIVCVLFDFCGGGLDILSDGLMTEMSVLTEAYDMECVLSYTETLSYVDKNKIALMGESQGGYVAAYVAAKHVDEIFKAILWYPAFVIRDDVKRRIKDDNLYRCLGIEIGNIYNEDAMSIDIYKEIGNYINPVLIIHGDIDSIVPLSYSQRARKRYKNAELIVIEGATHGFDGEDSKYAIKMTAEFVLRNN